MVRAGYVLVACMLWISSAQAEQWKKIGASTADVARDTRQCTSEAKDKVPPDMAPNYPQPMPGGNQLRAGRPAPGSTLSPSAGTAGSVTDFNRPARDRYFRKCMISRGYQS